MEKIPAQQYFEGKRIVLYGPESTGKSTLSQQLALHYNTAQVSEFARDYLQDKYDKSGAVCDYKDIVPIAIGQRQAENEALKEASRWLFCDTDLLETYVYSLIYFDQVPPALEKALSVSHYHHYLLMDIDTPWTPDDLRDKPNDRKLLFDKFEDTLKKFELPYTIISGLGDQRFNTAVATIDQV